MTTGQIVTKDGFNAMLDRTFLVSPTFTVPSRFGIGTGSSTPVQADTDLDTRVTAWSSGSDYKNYDAGYPTFDTVNQKLTTEGFVSPTEANGNVITELGEFNTDGTPVLFSRVVITGITKNSSVQITWKNIWKRV